GEALQSLLPVRSDFDFIACVAENGAQAIRDRRFVVGDEDSSLRLLLTARGHGSGIPGKYDEEISARSLVLNVIPGEGVCDRRIDVAGASGLVRKADHCAVAGFQAAAATPFLYKGQQPRSQRQACCLGGRR